MCQQSFFAVSTPRVGFWTLYRFLYKGLLAGRTPIKRHLGFWGSSFGLFISFAMEIILREDILIYSKLDLNTSCSWVLNCKCVF